MARFLQAGPCALSSIVGVKLGIHQRRFYASIRDPSAEALELLAPHANRILLTWRQEVHSLGLEPDSLLPGTKYSFVQVAKELRNSQYPLFKHRLEQFGESLARHEVKLLGAVEAYNRL